jgi:N-acetylglucosaminyldiphosphoundecaprenol N-acetyl-beta-D-mannosaminyltransferase
MKRVNVIGVAVSNTDIPEAVEIIEQFIAEGGSHYVCVCTVYAVMMCQKDEEYRRIHNEADLVTPDGRPLGWVQTLRGYPQRHRVYGPDLMLACCEYGV